MYSASSKSQSSGLFSGMPYLYSHFEFRRTPFFMVIGRVPGRGVAAVGGSPRSSAVPDQSDGYSGQGHHWYRRVDILAERRSTASSQPSEDQSRNDVPQPAAVPFDLNRYRTPLYNATSFTLSVCSRSFPVLSMGCQSLNFANPLKPLNVPYRSGAWGHPPSATTH